MSELPEEERSPSQADARMAELLARSIGARADAKSRKVLREEGTDDAEDLLSRLNALDYLDEVVGKAGGSELPEQLGDYRITGLLGRGGMGTVFEAFQESLERQVALKVLSPTLTSNPKMRRRFRIEARANASLHHQHIVPVFGFGESAGYLYFTMELVQGISLDKHIDKARRQDRVALEPLEAARRFAGVADALGHAHKRGILHRDVKPGNILVHQDGELALADFGLSKMVNEGSLSLSRSGGFLGTLHYTAPEQAKGGDVGSAADLYSLGVTLFEALTGRLPLRGKTTEAMLQAILHEDAMRLRDVLPKAPRNLDAVLRKLLRKDASERYQDGEALARDLLRVADGEPVRIRREALVIRAWRQVRKHPALSAAILAASLLFFLSTGLFISNERQRRGSLYTDRIDQAMAEAETGLGPVDGPGILLQFLAGIEVRGMDTPIQFREQLEQAKRLEGEDELSERMLAAYGADPLPAASSDMLSGLGFDALQKLDQLIVTEQADQGLAGRGNAQRLGLYNLFLARAAAAASVAVADVEAAVRDLLRASFLRPGAFFPRALTAILDWEVDSEFRALRRELESLLEDAPVGGRQVVGALLVATAGFDRPLAAELVVSQAVPAKRIEMHQWGVELLASSLPGKRDGAHGQLDRDLGFAATDALAAADKAQRDAATRRGQELLQHLAVGSPLRAWDPVYRYLANSIDGFVQADVTIAQKILGLERLARLALAEDDRAKAVRVMRDVASLLDAPVFAGVRDDDPVLRTHGRVQAIASIYLAEQRDSVSAVDVAEALAVAESWVRLEPGHAEAYFWRMRAYLLQGEMAEVEYNAAIAAQRAADRDRMREAIARCVTAQDPELARTFAPPRRGQ